MMEFSNEDLNKKIFIRYNLGSKLNDEGQKIPDNVLLEVSVLKDVEEVGQFITKTPDNLLAPMNTIKIKNDFLDDTFLVINATKTKNLVVSPMNPEFSYSEFITNFIKNNIAEIPKRGLPYIMEEKVQLEEYELAAILRDEIAKRESVNAGAEKE